MDSQLIYLTGGQASILIERLKNKGVDCLLHEFDGVIVGRSAGAMALCRKSVATIRSNSKVKIIEGFAFADLILKVHYKPEKDPALKRLSMQQKIYAIPEGSALVYNNGACSFIGHAYLFEKGEKYQL